MSKIIAIDPGKKKCGLLLADLDKELVLDGKVVDHLSVIDLVVSWKATGEVNSILLGNGTTSKFWQSYLQDLASIEVVEEKGTTLRARERYWELWPPPFWFGWLPRGLMLPSNHLDAVAALILLEDHLNKKFNWPGPIDFRIWP